MSVIRLQNRCRLKYRQPSMLDLFQKCELIICTSVAESEVILIVPMLHLRLKCAFVGMNLNMNI